MPAVLAARQCPHCVLRFGSTSELAQHVRLDHRPVTKPVAAPSLPEQAPVTAEPAAPEQSSQTSPFVIRAIITVALFAFIAVISWHIAALMSVALAASLAVRAAAKARRSERQSSS
jgi:hypothetical protein